MKVKNRKCILDLSVKNMKSSKARNIIAVIAIALTALLFTALFTIIGSISHGFQQSNFRMVGTSAHGEFKRLTEEQYDILKNDKAVAEYGLRRVLGVSVDEEFRKTSSVEISFMDGNTAEWSFVSPTAGKLPSENTSEAMADTRVLEALGITPEIGTEFTVEMYVDGITMTENFTLCGWYEGDNAAPASHILIAESEVDAVMEKLGVKGEDGMTGRYSLDVMLKNKADIAGNLMAAVERNGFSNDPLSKNYIAVGVNWGYMSESLMESLDFETAAMLLAFVFIIAFTGYLIIYNVFRISVSNDIRHYGLLKTIGTTGRQIKRIVVIQALVLSGLGIPLGLASGWLTGAVLTPVVINQLNVYKDADASLSPVIFVVSAVFAVVTVLISCHKPAKIASSVSPVEAVRYTEANTGSSLRKSTKSVSITGMAMANLGRSKGKTILTITSLALSILLFTLTFTFANSFDMETYLSDMTADFIVSDSSYFNHNYDWTPETAISDEEIEVLSNIEGIQKPFISYAVSMVNHPETFYPEELVREHLLLNGNEPEYVDDIIENGEKLNGMPSLHVMVNGISENVFEKIKVIEGDINKLKEEGYIAIEKSESFGLGDKITIRYTDLFEYVNTSTGEVYADFESIPESEWMNGGTNLTVHEETHDVEYEIGAVIDAPYAVGYRYSTGGDLFILEAEHYLKEALTAAPLCMAFDVEDEHEAAAEEFVSALCENSVLNYSSKATYAAEFEEFRSMFVILGTVLSLIVGLIGVLNFTNTILTGIISRRKEFAVLQAVGMTGKQLKAMLITEGLFYTLGAAIAAVILNLLTIPFSSVLEKLFWFCKYRFTITPSLISIPVFAVLGIVLPLIAYSIIFRKSVVERLRESE